MQKHLKQKRRQFNLLLGFFLCFTLLLTSGLYFLFFKNTHQNYSFTQSYKEYYSVEDWNLTMHAIADIDNDGSKDMLTFTNCAFLSSIPEDKISEDKRCEEPGMSPIVFPENTTTVGQKLSSQKPFVYTWLKRSYLVKTHNDTWKYYDINGLQLRTYEFNDQFIVNEVEPTLFDRIDVVTYQISHLGAVLLMLVLA